MSDLINLVALFGDGLEVVVDSGSRVYAHDQVMALELKPGAFTGPEPYEDLPVGRLAGIFRKCWPIQPAVEQWESPPEPEPMKARPCEECEGTGRLGDSVLCQQCHGSGTEMYAPDQRVCGWLVAGKYVHIIAALPNAQVAQGRHEAIAIRFDDGRGVVMRIRDRE